MVAATAALVLLGGIFGSEATPWGHHDVKVEHYRVTGWRLDIERNQFSGETLCTVKRPHITYAHGVITFALNRDVDTANAIFRVDGGPTRTAGSVAVEAAGLGAQFNGPDLTNPSNGEVHIPAADLKDAVTVNIQPNRLRTHRSFDLHGISDAVREAKKRGCDAI